MVRLLRALATIVLIAGLTALVLSGCGSSGSDSQATPSATSDTIAVPPTEPSSSASATAQPSPTPTSATAGDAALFDGFPDYPGAKKEDSTRLAASAPVKQGDYQKVAWQAYITGDPADRVAQFYKSELPKKGWQEAYWKPAPDDDQNISIWGVYLKDDNRSVAAVVIGQDKERTSILIMRAEGKNP